jgi:hypothetical protein
MKLLKEAGTIVAKSGIRQKRHELRLSFSELKTGSVYAPHYIKSTILLLVKLISLY